MLRLKGLLNEKIYYAGIEKCASSNTFSPAVIFLDWSQYGAPEWTEACPGVDLRLWSSWSSKPYTKSGGRKGHYIINA
jgi:hypothetical protein